MQRKIIDKLIEWKNSKFRQPLILQGARQVGKTYTALEFGKNYYFDVAYFNFETTPTLNALFDDLTPSRLIPLLSNYLGKLITPEKTLIIFDEVQLSERALTSLKYFEEFAKDYHIMALGSLLGVAVNRKEYSFPVGKVQFLTMYPLNFEEYLMAKDEKFLLNEIRKSYADFSPMPLHEKAMNLFKEYLVVGGMPYVVKTFIETTNFDLIRTIQSSILMAYFDDMSKYNSPQEISKTRLAFKNITTQLSKENTKFQYKLLKSGGRASEFENAIEWLTLAGVANQIYRVKELKLPLSAYRSLTDFKLYMNDVGLLVASENIRAEDIIYGNILINDFKGGLTENYIDNELAFQGFDRFYWTSEKSAEIDFIIEVLGDIIPVEVKSADNTRAKSLKLYMDRYNPKFSIRFSTKNFGFENGIKSLPLYAVFCLKEKI